MKEFNSDNIEHNKLRRRKPDYPKYLKGEPYANFLGKINNKATEKTYKSNLFQMCERLNLDTIQLYAYSDDLDKKKKPNALENQIKDVIIDFKKPLKENDPHATTIHMNIAALIFFCVANRINLNFKWIKGWLPKKPKYGQDKRYSREQIISMLDKGAIDARSKLIVYLLSTNGIREGALCRLRTRDISAFYDNDGVLEGASICVYRGEPEEDVIFTTPEGYKAYENYLEERRNLGEEIIPMSPVIIGRLPAKMNNIKWSTTEGITESTISAICVNIAVRAGERKLSEDYEHRYVSKVTYGFRKHFETTILNALNQDGTNKIDPYHCDRLLNHSRNGGLQTIKHYDDSSIKEFFQYYKRVIPDLTLSKEAEYKVQLEQAKGELKGVELAKKYIEQKEKEMNERLSKMEQDLEASSNLAKFFAHMQMIKDEETKKKFLEELKTFENTETWEKMEKAY